MRRLAVDLRSRPAPPRWAWGAVCALFALAAGLALAAYLESTKLRALKAERAQRQVQDALAVSAPLVPSIQKMPYDASAREMLALATSDWPSMLTALESAEVSGVLPVALELVAAEHWIRVEVEFSDYPKLLEYVDALNAGEPKPKWTLVQAQLGTRSVNLPQGLASTATIRGVW